MDLILTSRRQCLRWLSQLPLIFGGGTIFAQSQPTVAAASDLKFALEEVALNFEKDAGQEVRLVFGSSGYFYTQINQGAPFHMLMSADESFIFKLSDAGKTKDRGQIYAKGRIGIMVPNRSTLKADGELKDLGQSIKDGRLEKFAIANPDHAPYGMRAKEALIKADLWEGIKTKLVFGENISQATQFALSGSAQGGIIAQSLALSPLIERLGHFALIPESWHQPLIQRMALMKDAPKVIEDFYRYIGEPKAQSILRRFGFSPPHQQRS